jgi:hypothetical protein
MAVARGIALSIKQVGRELESIPARHFSLLIGPLKRSAGLAISVSKLN